MYLMAKNDERPDFFHLHFKGLRNLGDVAEI